ncbi:MAG: ubiquitin-like protein [Candidatus Hodarchaeota archaeon]
MKRKSRVLSIITLYITFILIYVILFILKIDNFPFYLFFTIGSVAVISTSTFYIITQSESIPSKKIKKPKFMSKKKSLKKYRNELVEDYFDAMPLIDTYANSDESYKNIPTMDDYIFSVFNSEELEKINLLDLSKMDKIFFLRELLYFSPRERTQLIEDMIINKDKEIEQIIFTPPKINIEMQEKIRVYVRSLIEPGEKTKIIIVEMSNFVSEIKEKIGVLFDYDLSNFVISSGGIILEENLKISDYNLDDDDEIVIIPTRKEKN